MLYTNALVLRTRLSNRARVKQIETFVAVAELGSVSQAARRLGISQPGVTKHLKDLEGLLDAPLFLRHAKGMTLSTTGRICWRRRGAFSPISTTWRNEPPQWQSATTAWSG